jgi:crotonobetainyl-CoA:carnitine CoA-transferase CaiB-like acyl-CoA transferase
MMKTPNVLPVQVADIAGGTYPAVIQILAALLHRQQTGKGCWIDVSMTDWALAMTIMAQSKFLTDGEPIGGGRDLLCGQVPCYDIYRSKVRFFSGHCVWLFQPMQYKLSRYFFSFFYLIFDLQDGHLAVAALEPKFWKALCKALQLPELTNSSMATGSEGEAVRSKLQVPFAYLSISMIQIMWY